MEKAKQLKIELKEVRKIKKDVFLLKLNSAYLAKVSLPGNFLHIKIDSAVLRRPFSIHKIKAGKVYILFRVRGRGTLALSQMKKGNVLDAIGPLGKGFNYEGRRTKDEGRVLVAGGIGVAPLMFLAQKLKKVHSPRSIVHSLVLLGAKTKQELLCESEFKKLGFKVCIATEDGSKGRKGTVTNLLEKILDTRYSILNTNIYACGPKEMFLEIHKVLKKYPEVNCEVSFEQFMGCGLGTCCACAIETKSGYKKTCKDGPVFNLKDIW